MIDSEFIELLNLYLDHEISTFDAGRLEREVQNNPERRRVYWEYCRMQKACTMLAKDFTTTEVAPGAQKVVAFSSGLSWKTRALMGAGLVAVAACVALVVVNRSTMVVQSSSSASSLSAAVGGVGSPTALSVDANLAAGSGNDLARGDTISRTVTMPLKHRSETQPMAVARGLVLSTNFSLAQQADVNTGPSQLDWINGMQIAPMPQTKMDDLRFDNHPAAGSQNSVFGSGNRPNHLGVVEMTAFQFQK